MTTSTNRVLVICLLSLVVPVLAATSWAQTRPPIAEQVAKAYGFDSFNQIERIRYTWSADLGGGLKLSRTWVWEPKTDQVSYDGKDKAGKPVKVTYLRSQIGSQPANVKDEVDPSFINDQYWLLFPFHLVWDTAKIEDTGMHKLPLGKGSAKRVVVTYAADVGYQPGDIWELFVGPDDRIQEWTYHRAGSAKPTVLSTWADYKKAGPLVVAMDHRGTRLGKPIRISFSDVSVQLVGGGNTWVNAQ